MFFIKLKNAITFVNILENVSSIRNAFTNWSINDSLVTPVFGEFIIICKYVSFSLHYSVCKKKKCILRFNSYFMILWELTKAYLFLFFVHMYISDYVFFWRLKSITKIWKIKSPLFIIFFFAFVAMLQLYLLWTKWK